MFQLQKVAIAEFPRQLPRLVQHVRFKKTTANCFLELGSYTTQLVRLPTRLGYLILENVILLNIHNLPSTANLSSAFHAPHERISQAER